MIEPIETADIVDDGVSDVLQEDEVVHVPAAAIDLAEQVDVAEMSTFIADVPNWDLPER